MFSNVFHIPLYKKHSILNIFIFFSNGNFSTCNDPPDETRKKKLNPLGDF